MIRILLITLLTLLTHVLNASEGLASKTKRAPAAQIHPCAADALTKALPLLRLHFGEDKSQPIEKENINEQVKVIGAANLLVGKGKVDVLEVIGHIYKATYRMRFLYAQIPGQCALMGQEIFEKGNPY